MATNQEKAEVPAEGNVSMEQATALFAQFEDDGPIDGGEGEEIDTDDDSGSEADAEEAAAAEDDGSEDEGDEGVDDDGDDDGDDPWISVKIDGEEQEVRLSELRNGYQRNADYTRKTQELAQQRKQVEQGFQQVQQQAVAYAEAYLQTSDQFAALAPSEDDIKDAWGYDPKGAAEMKERRERILRQAAGIKNMAVALHQQRQQALRQQLAKAAQELPNYVPEWSDMDTRKQELTAVAQYLVERGLDPREIEQTANPVAWAIARDAWKYRQLQQRTAAKAGKDPAPKIRKTRAPQPRLQKGRKQVGRLKAQFDKNPSKDNAIALLAQFEE